MNDKPFIPSPLQQRCFDWIMTGRGSAVWIAVAGSGKSTTIVRGLACIPEAASVAVLAFNASIAGEMRNKIAALGEEMKRPFRGVRASTFHSLGFGAVCRKFGKRPQDVETDGGKLRKLFRERVGEGAVALYGSFVPKLVSLAKGQGIGCLVADEPARWWDIISHHDLSLDSEDASEDEAIELARGLLSASNEAASSRSWIDFDDQLYLPVLWRLRLWQNDWVFIDEAQDTNPIRRAIAKMALRPGGRLVAVGDPNQAIYGFTGATHDAIDVIKREHRAVEMPLTVSYRCPRAAELLVHPIVPHFSVHEDAPEGLVLHLAEDEGIARLSDHDVIVCRNTAPLVAMAFGLITKGRGCTVLGKDIGAGLVDLVRKQRAQGVDRLVAKLESYRDREVAKHMAKGEEGKAEAIADRVQCVLTVVERLPETEHTVPALVAKLEGMFSDSNGMLTLCTAHKAKGREWKRVAILQPNLMPSKWARQEHQYQQEINLQYVAWTRFQEELIFLDGDAP